MKTFFSFDILKMLLQGRNTINLLTLRKVKFYREHKECVLVGNVATKDSSKIYEDCSFVVFFIEMEYLINERNSFKCRY